jgi:hypothetical protein
MEAGHGWRQVAGSSEWTAYRAASMSTGLRVSRQLQVGASQHV